MSEKKDPINQVTVKMGNRVPAWMNGINISDIPSDFKENQNPISKSMAIQPVNAQNGAMVHKPYVKTEIKPITDSVSTEKTEQPKPIVITSNTLTTQIKFTNEPVIKIQPINKFEPKTESQANETKMRILDSNGNWTNIKQELSLKDRLGLASQRLVGPELASQLQVPQPQQKPKRQTKRQQQQQNARVALGLNATDVVDHLAQLNKVENEPKLDDDKAEDKMAVAETYTDYKPAKLNFGAPHPDPVVETSSLSSVEPNDITYKLSIPKSTIDNGKLSALQLESIIYASQAHQNILADGSRAGFLIGEFVYFNLRNTNLQLSINLI